MEAAAATRAAFFIAGFGTAAWAPLAPYAKARLGVDAGVFGLVLIAPGIASVATMGAAGALASARGCRFVIVGASLALMAALALVAWVPSPAALAGALALFGLGVGGIDVAANLQGIAVEKAAGRPLMSGFHGFYRLGGIGGAAAAAALLSLGAPPLGAAAAVIAILGGVLCWARPRLLAEPMAQPGRALAWPRGIVWLLGALGLAMFLAEGAVLDWSGLFLHLARGAPIGEAGFGFVAFSLAMTAARLLGDRLTACLGGRAVTVLGGLLAAAGFAGAVAAPSWPLALVALALVGLGCANVVPALFTAAGAQTAMPQAVAVPAMTTLAYAGVLAGPGLLGLLIRAAGYPAAFLALALLTVAVAAAGFALPRKNA